MADAEMIPSETPVIFRARLHYGPPVFGYALALALVAVTGTVRLALLRGPAPVEAFPFLLFYPAIAVSSFLGGAGPGLAAIGFGAVFGIMFFPSYPAPLS